MNYNIGFLLGAGASKPFGIPTTQDMANEYLEITTNQYLKKLFKGEKDTDIENVIKAMFQIEELPNNLGIKLLAQENKQFPEITSMSKACENTVKELSNFIRDKCLNPDIEKASNIYKKIFDLRKIAILKIFSTNYDLIVEEVCKNIKIDLTDGFISKQFEDQKIFDIFSLNKGDVQLYKLHGSVSWWSDDEKQKIFKLPSEIPGIKNHTNLMIYPAQKENVFNFPYNILQWIFSITLNEINNLIVIGHKFEDSNITATVKAALENPNFELTLVNPSASTIKENIFLNHERVTAIDEKFENWVDDGIKSLTKIANKFNARHREEENLKIEQERKINELEDQIRELKYPKRLDFHNIDLNPRDWGKLTLDPNITLTSPPINIVREASESINICSKCKKILSSDCQKCPYCGENFSSE